MVPLVLDNASEQTGADKLERFPVVIHGGDPGCSRPLDLDADTGDAAAAFKTQVADFLVREDFGIEEDQRHHGLDGQIPASEKKPRCPVRRRYINYHQVGVRADLRRGDTCET